MLFQYTVTSAQVTVLPIVTLSPQGTATLTVTANNVNPPTDPFVGFELPDGRAVSFKSFKISMTFNGDNISLLIMIKLTIDP